MKPNISLCHNTNYFVIPSKEGILSNINFKIKARKKHLERDAFLTNQPT